MSGEANGHLETVVRRAVEREMEVRVGSVDVAVNQRLGPFEKYQAEVSGGITGIRTDFKDLRDEVVLLKGMVAALVDELKRDRLSRERRRKRATQ